MLRGGASVWEALEGVTLDSPVPCASNQQGEQGPKGEKGDPGDPGALVSTSQHPRHCLPFPKLPKDQEP